MRFLIYGWLLVAVLYSCRSKNQRFTVDEEIKDTVQRKLGLKPNNLAYQNELVADMWVNDKIIRTKKVNDILSFRTFHFWDEDTLKIAGGFGVESGYGFMVKIHNKEARVFHLIFSDSLQTYALSPNEKKHSRLEVPCETWDLKISVIPEKYTHTPIFGIISFKSKPYYEFDGNKSNKRQVDMDLHFFSRKIAN